MFGFHNTSMIGRSDWSWYHGETIQQSYGSKQQPKHWPIPSPFRPFRLFRWFPESQTWLFATPTIFRWSDKLISYLFCGTLGCKLLQVTHFIVTSGPRCSHWLISHKPAGPLTGQPMPTFRMRASCFRTVAVLVGSNGSVWVVSSGWWFLVSILSWDDWADKKTTWG